MVIPDSINYSLTTIKRDIFDNNKIESLFAIYIEFE